jgi:DNA-binding transcriptional MerR regulator
MDTGISLHELSEVTAIEPRTIRSYIERGLLPGPESRGRNATYSRDHIDRLRVLVKIRDANRNLTLDQIRTILHSLAPQQIREISSGRILIQAIMDTEADRRPGTALEYLASLRASSEVSSLSFTAPASSDSGDTMNRTPAAELAQALASLAGGIPASRGAAGQRWIRFSITPDIEMSVRDSFSPDQIAHMQRVADLLRVLLTKGVRE